MFLRLLVCLITLEGDLVAVVVVGLVVVIVEKDIVDNQGKEGWKKGKSEPQMGEEDQKGEMKEE